MALSGADSIDPDGPQFAPDGQLLRPRNYREWVFLSSGLGMTYGTPRPDARGLLIGVHADEFGDAEIEQLHRALFGDEDIGGLQITVNDAVLQGELNGVANGAKEADAFADVEFAIVAPLIDRFALDILHDEIGPAFFGGAGVVETGDVGMLERSQDRALLLEALDHFAPGRFGSDDFDGDLLFEEAVRAAREVDSAHAAPSDFAQDFIISEAASLEAARVGTQFGGSGQGTVEEGDGALVGIEHAFHLGVQIEVGTRRFFQEGRPFSWGFLQGCFKDIANLAEPLRRHFPVLHSAQREPGRKQLTYTTRSMPQQPVTTLLIDWRRGNREAGKELLSRMQPELRRIAAGYMRKEHPGHTLQATALVNELYLRLMGGAVISSRLRTLGVLRRPPSARVSYGAGADADDPGVTAECA